MPESVRIGENVGACSRKKGNPGLKLSDIARLAGVSVTTASYVINGKAEQQGKDQGFEGFTIGQRSEDIGWNQ